MITISNKCLYNGNIVISVLLRFMKNLFRFVLALYTKVYEVKKVVHHITCIVVDILSTVESDTNSENDDKGSQLSTDIEELGKDVGGDEDVSSVNP